MIGRKNFLRAAVNIISKSSVDRIKLKFIAAYFPRLFTNFSIVVENVFTSVQYQVTQKKPTTEQSDIEMDN